MVEEGKKKAEAQGVRNVTWITDYAERVMQDLGRFRLLTAGSSFHWMDRELVLNRAHESLEDDGGFAIIGGRSLWNGTEDWQKQTVGVIKKYLGEERRAGSGLFPAQEARHEEVVLKGARFEDIEKHEILSPHSWTVETILGNLYLTSFA